MKQYSMSKNNEIDRIILRTAKKLKFIFKPTKNIISKSVIKIMVRIRKVPRNEIIRILRLNSTKFRDKGTIKIRLIINPK